MMIRDQYLPQRCDDKSQLQRNNHRGWQRERERRVSLRLRSEFRVIGEKWMQRGVDCEGWMKNDV